MELQALLPAVIGLVGVLAIAVAMGLTLRKRERRENGD